MQTDEQYQKEYAEAYAALEAADNKSTTARDEKGRFAKAEEAPAEVKQPDPAPVEPQAEAVIPAAEEAKPEEEPAPDPVADELKALREQLEKKDKALKDTQAWATKNAQELARIQREKELAQREAAKPAILEQHPELVEAIRHVVTDPTPKIQQEQQFLQWQATIEQVHPGIFDADADPELVNALVKIRDASNGAWNDPLIAIRDITAEKLAHTERQYAKRLQAEAEQRAKKSAMTVPGAGATTAAHAADPAKDEVKRIQSMSPAEFERERRRVLGY